MSGPETVTPARLAEMSGLEFIAGMAEGRFAPPPIAATLNFRLERAERGRVVFRGRPRAAALNPLGAIHGGWFGAILDSCMACAVQTELPAGRAYTTLEYKIHIIRALQPDGPELLATGTADHVGRRTGVATGRLTGAEDGRLYATGSTTCLVFDL